ncbi:helix-turn-helix domain-containing protein [Gracilibacillus timonensis]|uniref:helix-turn-helix domain-containing protein n=1 Tax=Gracilibacillus timonensis TaxID=1816696 RepID=UPI0008254D9A|nr:helix-turn-helix transcriptional regulator [Gracilibacillus timonensis]
MQGFGWRLENLRENYGYSKKDVSSKLGFTQNVYGSYEREERRPLLETIITLAEIYQVSLDYLLRGEAFHSNNQEQANEEILREVIQVFTEKEISNPYILQPDKWAILNNQEIQTLESHFEWMVDNAKSREG